MVVGGTETNWELDGMTDVRKQNYSFFLETKT